MSLRRFRCVMLLAAAWSAGCSINHPIANDYPAYLASQQGQARLPKVPAAAGYRIDDATQAHRYEFRAVAVGYAHVWIVEFGKLLEQSLQTPDVRGAFTSLSPVAQSAAPPGLLLDFRLVNYRFENFAASVELEIAANREGQPVLKNVYRATGTNKAGQMMMAGVFGMKNAVNSSTKSAIDDILTQFLTELAGKLPAPS